MHQELNMNISRCAFCCECILHYFCCYAASVSHLDHVDSKRRGAIGASLNPAACVRAANLGAAQKPAHLDVVASKRALERNARFLLNARVRQRAHNKRRALFVGLFVGSCKLDAVKRRIFGL